jgi:GWxTD domain-containing protein
MKVRSTLPLLLAILVGVSLALPALPRDKDTQKEQPDKAAKQDTAKQKKEAEPREPRPLTEKQRQRQQKELEKELNQPFQRWLNEDVAYIITDEERQAFKRLQNAEEREQFIEQFWLRRDPTPDTAENEYKEEHYRRIAYANEHFASGFPGWKMDRGRIYITFGPADEVEGHPSGGTYERTPAEGGGSTSTFPFERWRYRYLEGVGQNIILEFVDRTMSGEYRLTMDPNEKDALLHVPNAGLTLLEQMGMQDKADRVTNADGTGQSFGALPSDQSPFERLRIYAAVLRPPPVKFKDLEEAVTSKIRYNLFPFQVRSDYLKLTSDTSLGALTVQIGVKDMTFQKKEDIQHAAVNIFGRVQTMTGRVVQIFEDVVAVDVPADQLQNYMNQQRVYWQSLPLRPGLYRLDLALEDLNSHNKGTYSVALRLPRYDDETLSASSLILADDIQKVSTKDIGKGQFVLGSTKVRPSVGEKFTRDSNLGIYLQVYNLQTDEKTHRPNATVEYALLRDDKVLWQFTETSAQIENASQQMTLEKVLPLKDLETGKYKLQVKVTDQLGKTSITPSATFTVQ